MINIFSSQANLNKLIPMRTRYGAQVSTPIAFWLKIIHNKPIQIKVTGHGVHLRF